MSDGHIAKRVSSMLARSALGEDVFPSGQIAGSWPTEVTGMGGNSRLATSQPVPVDNQAPHSLGRSWLDVIVYPLLAAALAVIVGAAASLIARGITQIVVWSAISAIVSLTLGLGHGSAQDRACRAACQRLWSWLASS